MKKIWTTSGFIIAACLFAACSSEYVKQDVPHFQLKSVSARVIPQEETREMEYDSTFFQLKDVCVRVAEEGEMRATRGTNFPFSRYSNFSPFTSLTVVGAGSQPVEMIRGGELQMTAYFTAQENTRSYNLILSLENPTYGKLTLFSGPISNSPARKGDRMAIDFIFGTTNATPSMSYNLGIVIAGNSNRDRQGAAFILNIVNV